MRFPVLAIAIATVAMMSATAGKAVDPTARAPAPVASQAVISISTKTGSPTEIRTKDQLERLNHAYDLRRWTFTSAVLIDGAGIPHSHPVLTLHTRHLLDDDLLLSTYVHEQLHWWLVQQEGSTQAAVADVERAMGPLPLGYPAGSEDAQGNYVHVLVAYLEWQAMKSLVGELRAQQVMQFWAHDHYTAIYTAVLQREREVQAIIRQHGLYPPRPF